MSHACSRHLCRYLCTFGLLLAVASSAAASVVPSCTPRTGAAYLVRFLPTVAAWDITAPSKSRITNRDRVEICIEHFNYLRYTLRFDVTEQHSDSYDYLTKLWSSILNPSLGDLVSALAAPRNAGPELTLAQWLQLLYARTTDLDNAIATELAKYPASGLSAAEAESLAVARERIASKGTVLGRIYHDIQAYLLDPQHASEFSGAIGGSDGAYTAVSAYYQAVVKRSDLFQQLSSKTIGIEVRKLGTRAPGTKVTLTLAAVDEGGSSTAMGDVSYLVETTLPLLVHAGIAFSGLRDVTFSKVQRVSGTGEEDLFQEKASDSQSESIAAFLSAQLVEFGGTGGGANAPIALLLTLGTGVKDPGKQIYAGPSLAIFGRVIVTAGAVFGKEAKGEQATLEPSVFRIMREHPKTKLFFSLSVKVH